MAEELLYASVGGDSNKRKLEDSPSPVVRSVTAFSSAPDSSAPAPSYSSVPPPMNEIELAKQKAQEIAARLLNNADPTKRARVENGDGGFDSRDYGSQKPSGLGLSGPAEVASSGYPGSSKKIEIPNGKVGVVIGKGGETIKYLQLQSGAKIQVTRDMDADPNSATRGVDLVGTLDQIAKAEQLIHDVLSEAEAGGSGSVSRRFTGQPSGGEQYVMKVPNNKVGLVIGKGGETIKNMQATTGARVQVIPLHLPPGDTSLERTVQIDGTSEQIEAAKQLVNDVISENRVRNSTTSGGGYPQQGYQARPPTHWGHPGPPVQQPGYDYTQPGVYPGPQYNTNQPPHSGYPAQPNSGGYTSVWDQSSAPQNHQADQGGGYDYYHQQPPQQQPPAYSQGQGYGQDVYGGYHAGAAHSGYSQAHQNPGAGYDQQQHGYNSTYSNVYNPTPHTASYGGQGETNQASAPGQSYNAGAQPFCNPNYPPQASNQSGYGVPPSYGPPQTQKPSSGQTAYAEPQQSPSAVGGSYTELGYSHSGQTNPGYQRPPSAGYPTSQPGFSVQPYAAPPTTTQSSYGQQNPPLYNSSYSGGGYSQPPAYSSDGPVGGNEHGTYDTAPPPPQSDQPSGSAKASPPS